MTKKVTEPDISPAEKLADMLGINASQILPLATEVGLLCLANPDVLAGDLTEFKLRGQWDDRTEKMPFRGQPDGDSVIMAMRVLIYRLRKYEGQGGKGDALYDMLRRLGYIHPSDVLR